MFRASKIVCLQSHSTTESLNQNASEQQIIWGGGGIPASLALQASQTQK
jgi:hypothetical protein